METTAKAKFDLTINRCKVLIKQYHNYKEDYHAGRVAVEPSDDILRASIVLAVAALDAYATDCFTENFVKYLKKNGLNKSIEVLLLKAGFDIKFAFTLIASDRPYRKIHTLINGFYSSYTTERCEVIDELFNCYGLKKITYNAANKSGKDPNRLLNSIRELVQRRHSIAHNGDYNKHRKQKRIDSRDTKRIDDLVLLVGNIDQIICSKFK